MRRTLVGWLHAATRRPRVGHVDFGDLRRLAPISSTWGFDRGVPVDRFYIDRFMRSHERDVRGRVLEIANPAMTRRYGGDRVTRSDVLHPVAAPAPVTLVGDLATGEGIPEAAFDCAIVTQTLLLVYDVQAAIRTLGRILAPGGVALVTVPGITKISREDMDQWGQFWSFTSASLRRLFNESFDSERVSIEAYGNVLAATAFLHGLSADELTEDELLHRDRDFEVLLAVRAARAP
ncbi:MAG TPA: methyltransferase domain-containing protein [Steroidobacteraceae bacterium]|jgi:SAM-dependent methyltransferase|nr:methyltransferase domain-containing protein [Steroidobacteraceae bacterium]